MNGYQDELSKIKEILKVNPLGLTVTDISRRININRNSVAKYMDVLQISGQVEMRSIGPAKVYSSSQRVPLSALLDYSSDHIIVFNSDLVVVQVNDNFLGLVHIPREELINMTMEDAPPMISRNPELKNRILEGIAGKDSSMEVKLPTGEAGVFLNTKFIPTTFDDGSLGVTLVIEDITQERVASEELERRRTLNEMLLNSLPHPALLVGRDRVILTSNQVARELGAEVGGLCWRDFMQGDHISEEAKGYLSKNDDIPPWAIHCVFCLADSALDSNKPQRNAHIEALGKMWDTYWIPLGDEVFLHYAIDVSDHMKMEKSLEALHRSAITLSTAKSRNEVGEMTLEIIEHVLGFNWGGILWVDEDKFRAEHYIGFDIPPDWTLPLSGSGITVRAAKSGTTQLVTDTREDPDYVPHPEPNSMETLSELAVPVVVGDEVVCVLDVQSFQTEDFGDDEKRLLEILGQHIASSLRRLKDENDL
ncbi:GAF domain-containing protein [Candidatus Bathyarchaeota archaeon]|nr:GAF domain-containing protein [Candidatus Bathyarchaeota archaeon]